ncbi:HEAT repeat domain-containing protein [Kitasatospora sp. NPDC101183]|uniref:HEAT repeat domain-containing protein n=1 Tax=Kitasatospora sp. NPDC101183 TaxID=3364100 RepID=UPI003829EEB7
MDLPFLLAAVERGDDTTVLEHLAETSYGGVAGEDGVALLAAAAYAGRHEVVNRLVACVDPTRPWAGGVDPVDWAAANGAYWVLSALLSRENDPLRADSPHRRALRVAQAALDSGGGAVPPPAHRGIITDLEEKLGIDRTPDELMARALVHADPEHEDWLASLLRITWPESQERFDWARSVVERADSLERRRFGLDAVNFLGFGFNPDNEDEPPFTEEAVELLRPRLATEQDPYALRTVVAAFTGYCTREDLPAVLPHVDHPDPRVRHGVARAFPGLLDVRPDTLAVLLRLADDPYPAVRTSAFEALSRTSVDTPALRAVLAVHLADPAFDARLEAAAALALRGDERATPVLDEVRRGIRNRNSRGAGRLEDLHYQLRARAEGPAV